ncbi:MAG: hypothetical protein ACI9EW_004017, partial [Cellvibrionaceae bacterium]
KYRLPETIFSVLNARFSEKLPIMFVSFFKIHFSRFRT